MAESELPYALIAVIVLGILLIGLATNIFAATKGLSKENFECKYLSLVPGFCTEADKQKIEQEKKQTQVNEINQFIDKLADTFKTCGVNSQQPTCKCSLEFSKLLDSSTVLSKQSDGYYLRNFKTNYQKKIESMTELNINDNNNKIVSLESIYNTNFIIFNTLDTAGVAGTGILSMKSFQITTGSGTNQKVIIELGYPAYIIHINTIGIFKQDNKKGIYIPYLARSTPDNVINIPDC